MHTVSGEYHDVTIIGAGFGGVAMAIELRRDGIDDLVILERAGDVGGTWRDNHYPGAACDVPSHLYSFASHPNPRWSHVFAPQGEILDYIRATVADESLGGDIRFHAEVTDASWDDATGLWRVTSTAGVFSSRVLVSAVGHLSEPKTPDIPGFETFAGTIMHSAAWDETLSLEGKRVGVIGTGASAIQLVPAIAPKVGSLSVFQRSAPYITPRPDRAYTAAEKRMFERVPEALAAERADTFWANEERYAQRRGTPHLVEVVEKAALGHLAAQIPPGPLRDALTPDYTIGCKRILKSEDYYPTFLRDNVELVTDGIQEVTSAGIRTRDGQLHELDVIVAATGFEAVDLPIAHRLHGQHGTLLADQWQDGMQAYATVAVSEFPNLWIINGPNTGLGHNSSVYIAEAQIAHIRQAVAHVLATPGATLEVSRESENVYSSRLDAMSQGTVWLDGGCRNWYVDARSNRLTTLWPDFAFSFREINGVFDPLGYADPERADFHLGALGALPAPVG